MAGFGLYNIYCHPLRRFPGPKVWAAYKLAYTVRNIQGQLPFKCLEFHRKYGPVVRIAPDELIFSDAKAWNEIYGMLPVRTTDVLSASPSQLKACTDSSSRGGPKTRRILLGMHRSHQDLRKVSSMPTMPSMRDCGAYMDRHSRRKLSRSRLAC